jgi:serine/threonine protein kinase
MAEIYLARSTGIEGFQKLVVLKRIHPQHASNREFVTMFLDEARIAATLQHPNIAQVYDIGEEGGAYFFTMEYIHGEDVRSILRTAYLRSKGIPLPQALSIVIGAAAGLHAAHDKCGLDGEPLGIVHRDVSPSNVLVSFDGCIKVVDFGVAKAEQRESQTRAGTLKGKVAYMSPEQCRGLPVDRRSDVFALGILLYELTLGKRLFKGDNEYQIMQRIVGGDIPRPSSIQSRYPAQLEQIVLTALAGEPAERTPSAEALQLLLLAFAREHRLDISPPPLAAFMRELFAPELEARSAAARSQKLASRSKRPAPVEPARPPRPPAGMAAPFGVAPGTALPLAPTVEAPRPAPVATPASVPPHPRVMPRASSPPLGSPLGPSPVGPRAVAARLAAALAAVPGARTPGGPVPGPVTPASGSSPGQERSGAPQAAPWNGATPEAHLADELAQAPTLLLPRSFPPGVAARITPTRTDVSWRRHLRRAGDRLWRALAERPLAVIALAVATGSLTAVLLSGRARLTPAPVATEPAAAQPASAAAPPVAPARPPERPVEVVKPLEAGELTLPPVAARPEAAPRSPSKVERSPRPDATRAPAPRPLNRRTGARPEKKR